MFSGKTTDDLIWAIALFFITKHLTRDRGEGGQRAAIPAPVTVLGPGMYWYFLNSPGDRSAYVGWLKREQRNADHIKWLGRRGVNQAVVIFRVQELHTANWDVLPGLPSPAPKGAATEIEDIEGQGPASVSPDTWQEYVESIANEAISRLQEFDREMQRQLTQWLREN